MTIKNPRLRLRIKKAAETAVRRGHPWVFSESIQEQNRPGKVGELAVVYDRQDRFLAVGLFDPDSAIRLRVLQAGKPQTIDEHWWAARLDKTLEKRSGLFDEQTNAYRCINGESDGFPGLVLDRYGDTLVLKLYTAAWLPRLEALADLISDRLGSERVVLRLSRNIQEVSAKQFAKSDGQMLRGGTQQDVLIFLETGIKFEADVVRGQKTGFFLDQRENRRKVESFSAGRRVLNAFSFSGGFSLYAARGGAVSVTDLDLSAHALSGAKRNFLLNQDCPQIGRCPHESIQADAFEWFAQNREPIFDLIVLDPPSLAKRESEREGAIRAYERLASLALRSLSSEGILVACSCSAHVSSGEFYQAIERSVARSGRRYEEILRSGHAPDHPAAFKEAEYLKGIYLRFGK
jgi:23S rRNA (cytosine1962-C5)-methyltransferase